MAIAVDPTAPIQAMADPASPAVAKAKQMTPAAPLTNPIPAPAGGANLGAAGGLLASNPIPAAPSTTPAAPTAPVPSTIAPADASRASTPMPALPLASAPAAPVAGVPALPTTATDVGGALPVAGTVGTPGGVAPVGNPNATAIPSSGPQTQDLAQKFGIDLTSPQSQLNVQNGLHISPTTGSWEKPGSFQGDLDAAGIGFGGQNNALGYDASGKPVQVNNIDPLTGAATGQTSAVLDQSGRPIGFGGGSDKVGGNQFQTPTPQALPLASASGADGVNAAALPNAPVDTRGGPDAAYLAAAAAQEQAHPGSVDPSLLSGGTQTGVSGALPIAGLPVAAPNTASTSASGLPLASAPPAYANLTGSDTPGADYLGQTITPGAGVDRLALAESNFDNFAKSSDPYYQKTLRDANSSAAGAGQLGSGQLRTSLGDAANLRNLQLDTAKKGFLNDATSGSIDDAYKNIGIAQQQQGFQANQQNTQFDQAARQTQIEEALRNGDYTRAMGLLNAGEEGNPTLPLAQSYGAQAGQAAQGAANLVSGAVGARNGLPLAGQPSTSSTAPDPSSPDYLAWLNQQLARYGSAPQNTQTTPALPPIDTGYTGDVYQPPYPGG